MQLHWAAYCSELNGPTISTRRLVLLQDWSWNRPALDYIEIYWFASSR